MKTIWLTRSESEVRCVESNVFSKDYTHRIRVCSDEKLKCQRLLCGYILKKDSPSCGMERVKIWDKNALAERSWNLCRPTDGEPAIPAG